MLAESWNDSTEDREECPADAFSLFRGSADDESENANIPGEKSGTKKVSDPIRKAKDIDSVGFAVNTAEGQTDLANARRLVNWHGQDIRFCHAWGKWLAWDGCRFALDDSGGVVRLAKAVADRVWADARQFDDRAALNFAARTASGVGIREMLKLAQSEVPILPEEMDGNGWLLNCPNGTIHLPSGELRAHRREDAQTKLCPVEFIPEALCPTWDRFLRDVFAGDIELIEFVQRLLGYGIAGDVREQVLPIFHGSGANGKSTLLNAVLGTLGSDYAGAAPKDLLMARSGDSHPTELASLFRKRLVVAMETEANRALAESLVKQLTGGDSISCRRMREDFWTFTPTHTLVLCTNHRPRVKGSDHAIWRRLRLVPFAQRFDGARQDKSLGDRRQDEREGILAWLVRGCRSWLSEGLGDPSAVHQATAEYRNESDLVGQFIQERCWLGDRYSVRFGQFFDELERWASDIGEKTPSKRAVGQMLTERGFTARQSSGRVYDGLGIKE